MMSLAFMFLMIYLYYIMVSSSHLLILLILIEFMVLFTFFNLISSHFIPLSGLFFLLVAVCVGAYSICLYIFSTRNKTSSYLMSMYNI